MSVSLSSSFLTHTHTHTHTQALSRDRDVVKFPPRKITRTSGKKLYGVVGMWRRDRIRDSEKEPEKEFNWSRQYRQDFFASMKRDHDLDLENLVYVPSSHNHSNNTNNVQQNQILSRRTHTLRRCDTHTLNCSTIQTAYEYEKRVEIVRESCRKEHRAT